MTLDEFIAKLQEMSDAGHGSLPVITEYDDSFAHLDDDDFDETVAVGVFKLISNRPYKDTLVGQFVGDDEEEVELLDIEFEETELRVVRIKS